MIIAIRLFSYLGVLAVVLFYQCSSLHAQEVFLVGEDTPVWLAERPDPSKPVNYTRLEQGIVKKAIDYWNVIKTSGGFPVRIARSVVNTNSSEPYTSTEPTEADGKRFVSWRNTTNGLLYPSILLVVDFDYFHSIWKLMKEHAIKETILYALAFWYSVDIELQQIQNPAVSLRITGIVINRGHKVSLYMNDEQQDWLGDIASLYINNEQHSLVRSLESMLHYWWTVSKTNEDFPIGSYDIVAHMTDSYRNRKDGNQYAGIASSTSPCKLIGEIAGVIVNDDFAFSGIHMAVKKMTNIFGDGSIDDNLIAFERTEWTPTSLSKISNGLKGSNGACMSAPKEYHPPGKPLVPVMAGELLPRAKQCEASGFGRDAWHCWEEKWLANLQSTCKYMRCSTPHWYSTCTWSNPTLDGTFCNDDNTKICVAGRCVDMKTFT